MIIQRSNKKVMLYTSVYSLVLYTLNNDPTGVVREALTDMLYDMGYEDEGDQSTLMLRDKSKQIGGINFLAKLNELCKKVKFHEGDVVTLINAGYRTDIHCLTKRDDQGELIPVMRRFRYEYTSKKCFERKEREE